MTEQTRLHYTWNAAERLLSAIRLPPVKDNRSAYAAATRLPADHGGGRAPFDHYYDGSAAFTPSHEQIKVLAEVTLAPVLFCDASRVGCPGCVPTSAFTCGYSSGARLPPAASRHRLTSRMRFCRRPADQLDQAQDDEQQDDDQDDD